MKEEKSKFGLGVLIGVLITSIVIFSGYFVYNEFIKKDNTPNKETKEKKNANKTGTIPDIDVKELINRLSPIDMLCKDYFGDLVIDKKVEAKNISSEQAYQIAERDYHEMAKPGTYDGIPETVSLEEMTKTIQKYLGNDYNFVPKTISKDICPLFEYDEETKTYIRQNPACGGTCSPQYEYKVDSISSDKGILKVKVKVAFNKIPDDGNFDGNWYSDYAKTNVISTGNIDIPSKDLDKGGEYLFTFKLEDGNYVFVSSEPVNNN